MISRMKPHIHKEKGKWKVSATMICFLLNYGDFDKAVKWARELK